jgi:hypothetical protein
MTALTTDPDIDTGPFSGGTGLAWAGELFLEDASYSSSQMNWIWAGVFECGARVYPDALAISTPNTALKLRLKRKFGGSIEQGGRGRWVLRSVKKRRLIYEDWSKRTLYRRAEIEAALDSLGSP